MSDVGVDEQALRALMQDELESSAQLATAGSLIRGDRGSFTPAFGGGAGPITVTVNHALTVVPGVVTHELNHALTVGFTVAVTAVTATQITFKVLGSAAVAADPVISWEARA